MTATGASRQSNGRRDRWAQRESAKRDLAYRQSLSAWQADAAELGWMADTARAFAGSTQSAVVLKRGEAAFFDYPAARLVEVQRSAGHFVGGYSGFSFRVAKGVRFNVAGSRGTFVPGAEELKITDSGAVTITNHRVVLLGSRNSREWAFAKMLGVNHDAERPFTLMHVSNRQKVSGLLYDADDAARFRFFLSLALAHHQGAVAPFIADLDEQRAQHAALAPTPPMLAAPTEAPGGLRTAGAALGLLYFGRRGWPRKKRVAQGVVTVGLTIMAWGAVANASQPTQHNVTPHPSATASVAVLTTTPAAAPSATLQQSMAASHKAAASPHATTTPAATRPTINANPHPSAASSTYKPPPPPPLSALPSISTSVPAAPTCQPLTNGGHCYEPGEFCRTSDHGVTGVAGDGEKITCEYNNGWRWEPIP